MHQTQAKRLLNYLRQNKSVTKQEVHDPKNKLYIENVGGRILDIRNMLKEVGSSEWIETKMEQHNNSRVARYIYHASGSNETSYKEDYRQAHTICQHCKDSYYIKSGKCNKCGKNTERY